MTSAYTIDAYPKGHGWIEGNINGFRFQAKLYDTGSKFGLNKGRVSKLAVWDQRKRQFGKGSSGDVFSYDRGWSQRPVSNKYRELLRTLLKYLKEYPTSENWGEPLKKREELLG